MEWITLITSGGAGTVCTWLATRYLASRDQQVKATAHAEAEEVLAKRIDDALETWGAKFELRFSDTLAKRINGTYLRSQGATLTGAEIERRLNALERRAE